MKELNRIRLWAGLLITVLVISCLTGCENKDVVASISENDISVDSEATDVISEEEEPNAIYVEANGLDYTSDIKVITQGTLCVGEKTETLDVINVDWELTNIVVEDAENGTKIMTVEQSIEAHIWTDGNTFATNLNVPVARLADAYNGIMIPVGDEDAVTTELTWKDNTYTVSAVETTSWEDGNWDTDWVEDPNGGERLSSTLIVKTVISIDEDYDGLVLVLTPITDANGSVDGDYIMDVWTEDSKLFNVNDMSSNFVADAEEVEETDADEATEDTENAEEVKAESKTEEAKPAETTATTAPKEEHKHSYTSTDSPSSCTVAGIRTYTCSSCGDSYTENLGYGDHNYVASTTTIHHDEVWQTTPRTVTVKVAHCLCDFTATNNEEWQNHRAESVAAGNLACGGRYWVVESQETVYDNVKTSDAWDETITTYTCSICGKTRN